MTQLTDETLMLYADGLLGAPEGERVAKIAAEDPEVNARITAFRMTGRQLADLFDPHVKASRPLPDWALGPLPEMGAMASSRRRAAMPKPWVSRLAAGQGDAMWPLLAASLALIAGLGLGWLAFGEGSGEGGMAAGLVESRGSHLVAQAALRNALESLPSGQRTSLSGTEPQVSMRMTFRNEADDYCREYEVSTGAKRYAGVACRNGENWIVSFQTLVPTSSTAGRIVPAGGSRTVLDAVVGTLIAGDPLTGEAEAEALSSNWSR